MGIEPPQRITNTKSTDTPLKRVNGNWTSRAWWKHSTIPKKWHEKSRKQLELSSEQSDVYSNVSTNISSKVYLTILNDKARHNGDWEEWLLYCEYHSPVCYCTDMFWEIDQAETITTAYRVSRIVEAADSLQYKPSMPNDPLAHSTGDPDAHERVRPEHLAINSLQPTVLEL